jgi:predicted nucleotidyltransferase
MTAVVTLPGLSAEQVHSMIPEHTILLGYRGSIAYGTYQARSDKDVLGVYIPPVERYLGVSAHHGFQRYEQRASMVQDYDSVVYELTKFVYLGAQANPNVLPLLWIRPQHYLYRSELGNVLINHRDLFNTSRVYHTFTGYAHNQLLGMTRDQASKGSMGQKRRSLVECYGYDTKRACTLILLLQQGIEFLTTGKLTVYRPDRQMLLAIKHGKWSLEDVQTKAKELFDQAQEAYRHTSLPPEVDWGRIDRMVRGILEAHFYQRYSNHRY